MAQNAFSFPRQWEDWTSWALGIWLLLSPWALFFDGETRAMQNALAIGTLIIVAEIVELSIFRDWEEWINVGLAAWLLISPWVLGIASSAARINFIIVGVLVVALAFHEIRQMRAGTSKPGTDVTGR
jgi:SPW repeat-containing protein